MRLFSLLEHIGADPTDDLETRLQKQTLVVISSAMVVLTGFWIAIYLAFGEVLAASIPALYAVASTISLAVFAVTKRYRLFRFAQLLLVLLLPFLLQLALGGFVDASAVIIWSLLAPLGALAMAGRRHATGWFVAYGVLVVAAQLIQPSLDRDNNLPDMAVAIFFVMNGPGVAGVIGRARFQYDVWGDTVNTASRMESHGVPGRIQVNKTACRLIEDRFLLEPRGMVEVKGKGPMPTWFLLGAR